MTFPSIHSSCLCGLHSPNKEEEKPKENAKEEKKEEKKPKDDSPRPRPLHRTCSLFMRSIAPTISKAEIIAVSRTWEAVLMTRERQLFESLSSVFTSVFLSQLCRRYPGFLRVCLSDPHPERRLVKKKLPFHTLPSCWSLYDTSNYTFINLFCCRFFRRCWVTFDRSINIKEVCWNLQNIRVSVLVSADNTPIYYSAGVFFRLSNVLLIC